MDKKINIIVMAYEMSCLNIIYILPSNINSAYFNGNKKKKSVSQKSMTEVCRKCGDDGPLSLPNPH